MCASTVWSTTCWLAWIASSFLPTVLLKVFSNRSAHWFNTVWRDCCSSGPMAVSAAGRARSGGGGKAGSRSASPGSVCSSLLPVMTTDLLFFKGGEARESLGAAGRPGAAAAEASSAPSSSSRLKVGIPPRSAI